MNKLLTITSSLLAVSNIFAEFSVSALHIDAKVDFNTAHVYEGRRILDQSFAPDLRLGLPLLDDAGKLYVGIGASLAVRQKSFGSNEMTPCVGFSYDITDTLTVDVGYTLHSLGKKPIMGIQSWDGFTCLKRPFVVLGEEGDIGYTDGDGKRASISIPDFAKVIPGLARKVMGDIGLLNGDKSISLEEASSYVFKGLEELEMTYTLEGKKRFHEIYAGITADVLLSPALYFGYDFTQKKSNIDGTIYHTFDLSSCGVSGLVLGLGGKVGYTRVKKPYGIAHDTRVFLFKPENIDWRAGTVAFEPDGGNLLFDKTCWFYAGANADVIYSLNENVKARAGIAFSYNNADEGSWINEKNHKKHNVWFSSGIEFTF